MACIEACVALDTSAAEANAGDAGVQPLGDRCPEPPFPCERLCWELEARGSALGGANGDADLAALGEPAIRCALSRANECRAEAALVADPPAPPDEPVSWTRLFLECAGLPTELDVFD